MYPRLCRHTWWECWSDCAARRAAPIDLRWSWSCLHGTSHRETRPRDEPSPRISYTNTTRILITWNTSNIIKKMPFTSKQTNLCCDNWSNAAAKHSICYKKLWYKIMSHERSLCFDISALTLSVGCQEEYTACKKIAWWGAGVVICLEQGANDLNDLHTIKLIPLPSHHLWLH